MDTTRPPSAPMRLEDSVLELAAREGLLDAPATWRPPHLAHDETRRELLPPPRESSLEGGGEGQGDEDEREEQSQHGDTVQRKCCAGELG